MPELILHPSVRRTIETIIRRPPPMLIISGPSGSGKQALVRQLANQLLNADIDSYPYVRYIAATEGIKAVRQLQQFMALKVPGTAAVDRLAIIADSGRLGTEAQTALLKLTEEPPAGSIIILTTDQPEALLPTIRSRGQLLEIIKPSAAELEQYFLAAGYAPAAVHQALLAAGGWPGTAHVILDSDGEQPFNVALHNARAILQATTFERLAMVNGLSKQKELSLLTVQAISQLAMTAIRQASSHPAAEAAKRIDKWQRILTIASQAEDRLLANGQTKLVLTAAMLGL